MLLKDHVTTLRIKGVKEESWWNRQKYISGICSKSGALQSVETEQFLKHTDTCPCVGFRLRTALQARLPTESPGKFLKLRPEFQPARFWLHWPKVDLRISFVSHSYICAGMSHCSGERGGFINIYQSHVADLAHACPSQQEWKMSAWNLRKLLHNDLVLSVKLKVKNDLLRVRSREKFKKGARVWTDYNSTGRWNWHRHTVNQFRGLRRTWKAWNCSNNDLHLFLIFCQHEKKCICLILPRKLLIYSDFCFNSAVHGVMLAMLVCKDSINNIKRSGI